MLCAAFFNGAELKKKSIFHFAGNRASTRIEDKTYAYMTSYKNLLIQENNGIILLTINREEALNALNRQTFVELEHFFTQEAPAMRHLKGIIITGAGPKAFIAGADIKELTQLDVEGGKAFAQFGQDVFWLMERFPKPIIAAVNGFALGGGCEFAMACHLRVAGEKAKFGQPEVNLGLIPGFGGSQRLVRYLGRTKALELLLTADMLSAQEALDLGLVNYVVPAGEEVQKSTELIEKIAGKGPLAVAKIIETVNAYYEKGFDGFAREVKAFGELFGSEDFKEGTGSFLEKRRAEFRR